VAEENNDESELVEDITDDLDKQEEVGEDSDPENQD
jgi:hypothetical protein